MKPTISRARFGWIDIDGRRISHDILIKLDGEVKKRKKELSKEVYGTSHMISLTEAEFIHQDGADTLLIGSGHFGRVQLSPESAAYFQDNNCGVEMHPTPQAVKAWNKKEGKLIGLFHITC
jgi:hypothetical protein